MSDHLDEVRAEVAALLATEAGAIDPEADLIELGLDSIRMMAVAGGWRSRGATVNFAQLAETPTVAAWARLLAESDQGAAAPAPEPEPMAGDALEAADTDDSFPLAPMAHAYWTGRQTDDLGNVAAHLYVEFDGPDIDPERLRAALLGLLEIHPMLRAQVLAEGRQRIGEARDLLAVTDLRAAPAGDRARELATLRDSKTHQLLDVHAGRVLDVALTRLPDGSRLHVDIDMIAADALSYRVFMRDLARLYLGEEVSAPAVTYRRYLDLLPDRTAERAVDAAWWRERLDDLPGAPDLPLSAAGRTGTATRVVRLHHHVDAQAAAAIAEHARAQGVTAAMALAAVFASTVGAWSATESFLLNLPMFHREPVHPEIDRVVGDFTSSVLLDVQASAESLAERARDLQNRLHRNASHSALGGLDVLRMLGRARGEQVLAPVVYTSALGLGELFEPVVTEAFGGAVSIVSQGPQVLLDAQVTEFDGGLLLNWDIRADAFEAGVAQAMFDHYRAGVDALVAGTWTEPGVADVPAAQLVRRAEANDTGADNPPRTLHGAFFVRAQADPDAVAVTGSGGTLTYGELARQALAVAACLRAEGVKPADAVAIRLPKGPDQVVAALGVLAAGGVYVPVGYDQPEARRGAVIAGSGARVEISDDGVGIALADARGSEALVGPVDVQPGALAYILYTSGSTGTPKGVEVSHDAAANTIDDLVDRFAMGPGARTFGISALEFDLSVFDVFAPLAVGGAVVTVTEAEKGDPAAWLRLVREHGVTVVNCVPSILDLLLVEAERSGVRLDSLRTVLLGGDRVGADLPLRLAARADGARFAGLGGATEAAIHSTVREVPAADAATFATTWDSVPYGTPLHNVLCRVTDSAGRDRPDWVPGELWIGGRSVADGYRGEPERTARQFVTAPAAPGGRDVRWYRTGDRARYLPDGSLDFLGRADDQVKVRGYRVELGEVEAALRGCPGVTGALATVVTDGRLPAIAAAVCGTASPDTVLEAAAARLPAYMVPARVAVLAEFPLTGNGKIDRKALRVMLAEGAAVDSYAEPQSDLERALASLVAAVLADPDSGPIRVGRADDFFGAGGDSIQATALVARLRAWLDAPSATVADVFAGRTVAGIAERLRASDDAARLEAVAQIYLEVTAMDEADVEAAR
ncbi:amino acid adenylation domain-containing protein [Tsukamurella sp. 8F]|uniref:amino acid adenylation domain-containing protein n=1 Tax=unclassified Tsukamurella TaxID=2633480 RepID=UPI0023B9FE3F|nr:MULTISPECIES: amino acid adenylation domain-containing protein [unclassified Tsukamurella]MDF0529313.1 amino acid adenylation domain-containing protein [Tsukamurella sp. 8J]MDF0587180.1 amino acid adenylation domain-containing protein [Tsukamurella sp. 8F]